jgi:2-C-methyl-D-erythritol 2,4-cyclodiphosphate synthase
MQAPRAIAAEAPSLPFRVGHGFDLHRLAEGYDLIIGGKKIPHTKGCEAHSDGDVLLHCVTDAILGAPPALVATIPQPTFGFYPLSSRC